MFAREKTSNKGLVVDKVLSLSYGKIIVKPEEKMHGLVPASFKSYQIVEQGDIIVRSTDLQNDHKSWRFGLCNELGIITSAYICLNPKEVITSEYAYLLLHVYDATKIIYGLGSGLRQNLSWDDFKFLPCIVPPISEQNIIVNYVAKIINHIDERIENYQQEIALLQEYRTRLIADIVTGKLDVREAAARLPEELAEPELLAEDEDLPEDEEEMEDQEAV